MPRGRPTKWTAVRQAKMCALLGKGLPTRRACASVGILEVTHYEWVAKGREGLEPYAGYLLSTEKAIADGQRFLVDSIVKICSGEAEGTWTGFAWLLERRWPKEFGRGERTSAKPQPVVIAGVTNAPDAQHEDVNQVLARAAESVRAKWHEAQRRKAEAALVVDPPVPSPSEDDVDDEGDDESGADADEGVES